MRFTRTIGVSNKEETKAIIKKAEDKLSSVFTELSLGYDNKSLGVGWGGDPFVFQLVYPLPHYCDITAIQLDELKEQEEAKQKEIEERLAKGETISEDEITDEVKKFRRAMRGRVLRTAATDGARFYWSPTFVNKISKAGLRIVVFHEAAHAIYQHVGRRGSRMPKLWNIAVDYRVNFTIMEDLRVRDIKDYPQVFEKELGPYIHLEEYAAFLKDPFNPPPRLAHFNPIHALRGMVDPAYQDPGEGIPPMYYADHQLSQDMKRPENVYDYLLAQIPKCPKCGRLGKYKKPDEYKALEKKIADQKKQDAKKKAEEQKKQQGAKQQPAPGQQQKDQKGDCCNKDEEHDCQEDGDNCCDHDHGNQPGQQPGDQSGQGQRPGQGQQPGQGDQPGDQSGQGQPQDGSGSGSCCDPSDKECKGCGECGGDGDYIDPFGAGDTLDDHMDSDVSEDELSRRLNDAAEIAKRMAGKVPGGLEDEIGSLLSPIIRWEDLIIAKMKKRRMGYGRNDWTRPKSRPLFAGLYNPRQRDYFLNVICAYDCSGSMSQDDVAFIISQLQVIDTKGEISLVGWDTQPAWDAMVKINKADKENLMKARRVGLGGTDVRAVFDEYEDHCGKVDMIIIGTDGFLSDSELKGVKIPPKDVDILWLISSHNPNFKPPFGRVLHLRNEKL